MEQSEQTIGRVNDAVLRMAEANAFIGQRMQSRGVEINAVTQKKGTTARHLRLVVDGAAAELDDWASRIETEIPIFSEGYRVVVESLGKAMAIYGHTNGADLTAVDTVRQSFATLKQQMQPALAFAETMRETIDSLPPLTTRINLAKQKSVSVMNSLASEFGTADTLIDDMDALLAGIFGET